MVITHVDVKIFNVIRYAITSLLLVPCLEWALQNIVESFGARYMLRGGIVRWGGLRLGRLSPVPYSFNRKSRLFAAGAGALIHSASLLGEFGFGAQQMHFVEPTDLFSTNASAVQAYSAGCKGGNFRVYYWNENPSANISTEFKTESDCNNRQLEYTRGRNYNYFVGKEEFLNNLNPVSSTITANGNLDWKTGECPSRKSGVIHYLRNSVSGADFIAKQNSTFVCFGTSNFQGFFCFSKSTSSVTKLYHSIGGFPDQNRTSPTIYLFAKFYPPVEVPRMYFILSAIHAYAVPIYTFTGHATEHIQDNYRRIGCLLSFLLSLREVLSPAGKTVNSIFHGEIVATIEKEGIAFIILLCFATGSALLIALICIYSATKDSRGRVVKVKSEAKYVIDLIANDILGNEDCAAPVVSDFGIALTSNSKGRQHICIGRQGVAYKGGIIG